MSAVAVLPRPGADLASQLIESDAVYFELGARVKPIPGADFVWAPGLAHVSAGCVVQRVRPRRLTIAPSAWVRRIREETRTAGGRWIRVYLTEGAPALEAALMTAGLRRRTEIGFIARGAQLPPRRLRTEWRPVRTEEDWTVLSRLRCEDDTNSDGYRTSPEDWTSLMRLKDSTGEKQTYLLLRDGAVRGEVSTMEMPGLLRVKNLYVSHAWRGQGTATDAVHLVWNEARRLGKQALGVFGLDGEPGAEVYRHAGMLAETSQTEWSCKL